MKKIIFLASVFLSTIAVATPMKGNLGASSIRFINSESLLPDGIVAVEYIQSTTNKEYIVLDTTNYLNDSTLKVELMLRIVSYNDGCIGCGSSGKPNAFYVNFFRSSGCYFRIGNYSSSNITRKWYSSGINVVVLAKEGASQNGVVLDYTSNFSGVAYPFLLFAQANSSPTKFIQSAIYACKMWAHDEIIYDLVPIRFKNENDELEGGLYDFVSGVVFRNVGNGNFIIGPDKR